MPGTLVHSPADVVRQMLINMGHGSAAGTWPIFTDTEPNAPDNCLTIRDTQGRDGGREMVTGERAEHHGIQVRVRAATHPEGWKKARAIAVALDKDVYQETAVVGGTAYEVHAITRTSDVITLGKETSATKRSIFTLNALVSVRTA